MKNKSLRLSTLFFFIVILFCQTALSAQIANKDYKSIPDSIKKEILDSLNNNVSTGQILDTITRNTKDTLYKKYNFSFISGPSKIKGIVSVLASTNFNKSMIAKAIEIEIPIERKCCIDKNKQLQCYNPDDEKGISKATREGCTGWFTKTISF